MLTCTLGISIYYNSDQSIVVVTELASLAPLQPINKKKIYYHILSISFVKKGYTIIAKKVIGKMISYHITYLFQMFISI